MRLRICGGVADDRFELLGGFFAVLLAQVNLGKLFTKTGQVRESFQQLLIHAGGFLRLAQHRKAVAHFLELDGISGVELACALEHFERLRPGSRGVIGRGERKRGVKLGQID